MRNLSKEFRVINQNSMIPFTNDANDGFSGLNENFVNTLLGSLKEMVKRQRLLLISDDYTERVFDLNSLDLDSASFVHDFVNQVFKGSIALDEQESIYLILNDQNRIILKWAGMRYAGVQTIEVSPYRLSTTDMCQKLNSFLQNQKYEINIFSKVLVNVCIDNKIKLLLDVEGVRREVNLMVDALEGEGLEIKSEDGNVLVSFGAIDHSSFFHDRDYEGVDPFLIILDKIESHFNRKWNGEV